MTEERKITGIPGWARRIVELTYLGEDMDVTQLEIWEKTVRPIVLDPELSKKYSDNYSEFNNKNCFGCFEGDFNDDNASTDHVCPLFASYAQADYKKVIIDILEGRLIKCNYRYTRWQEKRNGN